MDGTASYKTLPQVSRWVWVSINSTRATWGVCESVYVSVCKCEYVHVCKCVCDSARECMCMCVNASECVLTMCVCVRVGVYRGTACVCLCRSQRLTLDVDSWAVTPLLKEGSSPHYLRKGLHWMRTHQFHQMGWTGTTGASVVLRFQMWAASPTYHMGASSKIGTSSLCGKHLIPWSISQGPTSQNN